MRCRYFNPRPREEGDKTPDEPLHPLFVISIHALVKRATVNVIKRLCAVRISIHALVKRATAYIGCNDKGVVISIHALVKRATGDYDNKLMAVEISIHALVKRATNNGVIIYNNYLHFNPRPREEGDPLADGIIGAFTISIHALVKRAT